MASPRKCIKPARETIFHLFIMNVLPLDIIERVGKTLASKDLASFCRSSATVANTVRPELLKRRKTELDTFRTEVRRAVCVLKTQLLRSMIRQLDDIMLYENGHFPQENIDSEGTVIAFTTMPDWSFVKLTEGVLHGTCSTVSGDLHASVAYGQSKHDPLFPERIWLGACISSIDLKKKDGQMLGRWVSTRPWAFRNDFVTPTRIGFVENDTGMFWIEPMDLLGPMSGTAMCNFPLTYTYNYPTFKEHVSILDDELISPPGDNPAAQVFRAWEDSAIVLLDRYRTRPNNQHWLHTDYATPTPDWMDSEFPRDDIIAAFERALGPNWTFEHIEGAPGMHGAPGVSLTIRASMPWRSGKLVATYDVESNWRDVRFHTDTMTAMFRFDAPGLVCSVVENGVTDSGAITDDVHEFANLARRTGMPVLII